MTTTTYQFTLNGVAQRVTGFPDQSLLEVLREQLRVTSVKNGCAPQGQCGCCLVLVNGAPKDSCAVTMEKVEGKEILTLEGVSEDERQLYAKAFLVAAGLQCGFCTPGLVLRIKWLTDRGRLLTRAEIAKALNGHLCRCTGYIKIIDAVEMIFAAKRGVALPELPAGGGVGQRTGRYQGIDMALGTRPYIADMTAPGMLHGVVVLSPHARAKLLGIDTQAARALQG